MNWFVSLKKFALTGIITNFIENPPDFQVQDESYSCGNAVVQNLFRLLKREMPSEDNLKQIMDTSSSSGTDPKVIEQYLKDNNIIFQKYLKQPLDQLLKSNILLIEYQDYQKEHSVKDILNFTSSHFGLIIGFDNKYYYLVDSLRPKGQNIKKISKNKFLSNWKSRSFDGTKIERWGLIIPFKQS